ncbi:MAG: 2-oxo acid dehydrogenase subunit E2, partial [Deltaproteobacteria bacterium]
VELTKMRKVIAERLSESKRVAPHFYIDMTVDATNMTRLKAEMEKKVEQLTGLKLTLTDILTKLVAQVLKEFPAVNASFLGDRIRFYQDVNIGVAVGIEEGLVVPVVRNADQKSISQICQEVKELVNKARNKKLLPHEYSGGTFTITNLGMFGVENFHAIINQPESAILAVSSVKQAVVVVDGKMEPRPLMNLSLSVDHRVVDGVMAARFLGRVKELIESPYLLFV